MTTQTPPSSFTKFLVTFRDTIYANFLGGPKLIPMRYNINLFKGFTFLWVIFLMHYFDNFSKGMYLYLFLHGTYGIFWLAKDIYSPDASFKQKATFGSHLILFTALTLYWMMPLTIAKGMGIQTPSQMRTIFCIVLYLTGVVLMMGSDIHKNRRLLVRKGLISDGFFSRTRNPNYLGEVMIYGSFAICTGFWISYFIVMFVWFTLFAINMYLKDQLSYKHKQGWDQYRKKTYIFLPKIFSTNILNFVLYLVLTTVLIYFAFDSREMEGVRKLI